LVVGILSAFGLDAWWDGRQALSREVEILGDLAAEFEEARAHVALRYAAHESRAADLKEFLALTHTVGLGAELDVSDRHLTQLLAFNTLEVPMGVLESIIGSGEIALISDRTLRAQLTTWPTEIGDAIESQALQRDLGYGEVLPAMGSSDVRLGITRYRLDSTQARTLRVTSVLRNFVAARLRLELIIVSDLESVLESLDEIERRLK
jgi:hypothetical protein